MEQRDFDASMSKILNGIEMIAELKMQGIGPDKYEVFKVSFLKIFIFLKMRIIF